MLPDRGRSDDVELVRDEGTDSTTRNIAPSLGCSVNRERRHWEVSYVPERCTCRAVALAIVNLADYSGF